MKADRAILMAHGTRLREVDQRMGPEVIIVTKDSQSVSLDTPAKANLYLHVLGKREDGYHTIDSLFQAVSLYDRLYITRRTEPGIGLAVKGNGVPDDESNLVIRAFQAVESRLPRDGGVDIALEKHIPVAAGLGGGSSDAAATIYGLNVLFDLGLDRHAMAEIGAAVGSDVPFFFSGGQARVTGRGEFVDPIELPLDYAVVLITPALAISTADAYAELKMGLTRGAPSFNLPCCRSAGELWDSLSHSGNDFERAQIPANPVLAEVKQALVDSGARLVRMSGSGPTVCGFFENKPPAELPVLAAREGWQLYVVKPIRYLI